MDENKYYTPDISEFYSNFEYEAHRNNKWIKIDDFTNAYDYDDSCFYGLIKELEAGNIRVKYLDQEDMESLGFKRISEGTFEMPYSDSRGFDDKIHVILRKRWVLISQGNDEKMFSDWIDRFSGFIKNKSELKKILKMIGV
jgi:hypothetical protein